MLKISQIKRGGFSDVATREDGALLLDNSLVHSECGNLFAHSNSGLMQHIELEWKNCQQIIDWRTMLISQLLCASLDYDKQASNKWSTSIMEYAHGEMLAMRGGDNPELFAMQNELYSPILSWLEEKLAAKYHISTSIIAPAQPSDLIGKIQETLNNFNKNQLLVAYVLSQTLTSFALSYALIHSQITPEMALKCAWLEHDIQMKKWGEDEYLLQKRENDAAQINSCMVFLQNSDVTRAI